MIPPRLVPRRLFLGRTALLLPALLLADCGGPPPPAILSLTLIGGPDQNPSAAGTPATVAVRIFQLTATAKFERADVFALTEREAATLGQDSLASDEFVLSPGEQRKLSVNLKPGVQFIGAVVLYRDIDTATWRAFGPVAASGPSTLTLRIGRSAVSLG